MANDALFLLTASLLRRGRSLDRLSTVFSLLALLIWLPGTEIQRWLPWVVLGVVLLGLVQKYWALRVAVDADLFAALAKRPDIEPAQMDTALLTLGLAREPLPPRDWAARSQGALRLLRRQACWLAAQCAAALIGIVLLAMN